MHESTKIGAAVHSAKVTPKFDGATTKRIDEEMVFDLRTTRSNMVERLVYEALQARALARQA